MRWRVCALLSYRRNCRVVKMDSSAMLAHPVQLVLGHQRNGERTETYTDKLEPDGVCVLLNTQKHIKLITYSAGEELATLHRQSVG